MPRRERYQQMTAQQLRSKLERQRRQRLTNPAVNGNTKSILGGRNYLELYDKMMEEQGDVCAICRKPPTKHRLHMDHNHKTGKIRGLLCWSCNYKLGFVEKYLPRITRYLRGAN